MSSSIEYNKQYYQDNTAKNRFKHEDVMEMAHALIKLEGDLK